MSDIHQSTSSPSSHNSLITSLLSDIERQINDGKISSVDALIICGDFIEGSTIKENYTGGIRKIRNQYIKVKTLLDKICDELFEGDKNRIIMVPGNHDVSWQHSNKSMKKIKLYDSKYVSHINKPRSNIRWNSKDGLFYYIDDPRIYKNRFHHFSKFYSNFYNNTREYSLNPNKQYDLFEYSDINLIIAGFNSCHNNDHLNQIGWINLQCIDDCYRTIKKGKYRNWMKIAVWHHGYRGKPGSYDFLSDELVKLMIDRGFHLGLHGHEHRVEKHHIETDINFTRSMIILGCGTVYAPRTQIPRGNTNEYNLLNLDIEEQKIKYFVRNKISPGDIYIWDLKKEVEIKSYIQLSLFDQLIGVEEGMSRPDIFSELAFAQSMIANHEYRRALDYLEKLDQDNTFVRTLQLRCFVELEQNDDIIRLIADPASIEDYALLTDALWKVKKIDEIKRINNSSNLNEIIKESQPYRRMIKKIQDRDEHGKN